MTFAFFPQIARLLPQLILALVAPTLLVGVLIGAPLVESRRALLLEREQRRAAQAGETVAVLLSERLQLGRQMLLLVADSRGLQASLRAGGTEEVTQWLSQARGGTTFACLSILSAQQSITTGATCPKLLVAMPGITFESTAGMGLTARIVVSIDQRDVTQGMLVGIIPIEQALLDSASRQQDLDLGIVIGGQVVASSLQRRSDIRINPEALNGDVQLQVGSQPYLVHYTPLADLQGQPAAFIEVLLPLAPVRAAQMAATLIIVTGTMIAMLLAVVLGWAVARHFSGIVDRLRQVAVAIGAGDLTGPRIEMRGPVEIRQLSAAIEQMRQQLAQSRQALEAEKQRYAGILESIDEAVLTLDASTRVTSINQGGETMLGYTRQQVLGQALAAIIRPDDGHALRLASIPRHGSVQIAIRTAAQLPLMVAATCTAAQSGQEQILVLRDISDDAAVRQLKDAFLANITHEFRTPLAAQIASLEILREDNDSLTATERRQMLDALHLGVQRLDLLIQNLLDNASIEAGYFRVEPEPCQLAPLIQEAVTLVEPLIRQRGQSLEITIDETLPAVMADGRRIVQVLVNLLANANKFGPPGDRIQIEACRPNDVVVRIAITDHGPGVPESRRERLFDRFIRPGVETIQAQGAGLGLAIVKAIIDRHGGEVDVSAGVEYGATVAVTIPLMREVSA